MAPALHGKLRRLVASRPSRAELLVVVCILFGISIMLGHVLRSVRENDGKLANKELVEALASIGIKVNNTTDIKLVDRKH